MTAEKTRHAYVEAAREELHKYAQGLLHENEKLQSAVAAMQQALLEGQQYTEEYQKIEQQTSNLSNLYVASYQLHSSVDRHTVLQTIQEIVINLIGSEEIAVFEADSSGRFQVVAATGMNDWSFAPFRLGEGLIGRHLLEGEVYISPLAGDGHDRLTACVPLKIGDSIIGGIAVFRLLPHKTQLEQLDRELFDLLAVHAATALYCATLHEKSLPQEAVAS
ncbi:MAG TPA: GAF domain-containing protein [Thermoanaerobaculia bacterium]